MVIGDGLIGKNMNTFVNNDKVLIFASGVSNSKENKKEEFKREFNLLSNFLDTKQKLIYFSTCTVLYDCVKKTDYVKHKLNIEKYIQSNFENFIIFRLPNVVGVSNNNNTSFNFFKKNLLEKNEIVIEERTTRYFIDIDDVVNTISPIILNEKENKKIFNVCFDTKISINDFITLMSNFLKIEPKINKLNKGCSYDVDNKSFLSLVSDKYKYIDKDYNYKIIKKYC